MAAADSQRPAVMPRTVRFMTRNHLPGGQDLGTLSTGGFAETTLDGIGFGLGFAVVDDEEITALLFTQLMPSSTYPLRSQLRQLVYAALVD